jgi:hypothetical protein
MVNTSAPLRKFKVNVVLEDSANYPAWRVAVQTELFSAISNTNMAAITTASTLDPKLCKDTFGDDWKQAAKDRDGNNVDPFDSPPFVQICFAHALLTGECFKVWLPIVFAGVRASLCAKIAEQTNSVPIGDLVALFQAITLAIGFNEVTNPEALEIAYAGTSMGHAGQNDIMTYISVLASQLRRLSTAGHKVSDAKACRVLLTGLDQEIFESFISSTERTPYASYPLLVKALQEVASKPHTLAKLRALKPGVTHSAMTTRHQQAPTSDHRMDRVEAILATIVSSPPAPQLVCFNFQRRGSCSKGAKCPYKHVNNNNSTSTSNSTTDPTSSGGTKYCKAHQANTHDTKDCAMINANPQLKAFYADESQRVTTTVATTPSDSYSGDDGAPAYTYEFLC